MEWWNGKWNGTLNKLQISHSDVDILNFVWLNLQWQWIYFLNILTAKERKQQKQPYDSLFSNILAGGKLSSITYSTLEIGTLGDYFPTDAQHSMELLFPEQHSKWHRNFLDHWSKIVSNCLYIFNYRRLPSWTCPDLHSSPLFVY